MIAKGKKKLNVKEFTTAFEETENVESHKWLVSVHHTNTTIAPKELQGDAVWPETWLLDGQTVHGY